MWVGTCIVYVEFIIGLHTFIMWLIYVLLYADDTIILSGSASDLQNALDSLFNIIIVRPGISWLMQRKQRL